MIGFVVCNAVHQREILGTYLIIETMKLQSGLVITVMALPKNSSEQDNSSKL